MWLKKLPQTSEQVPEEKLHVVIFKSPQKDLFCVLCLEQTLGGLRGVVLSLYLYECKKKEL